MARRPAWLPGSGGGGVFLFLILLIIVAALIVWARSRHPVGRSHPAATGVPPTLPARAVPARR